MQRQLTDLAKVIAAIAVVGIHATSTAENNFARSHDFFSLDFAGVFLNQWARFSVPLFLYLSAYGLAVSEKNPQQNLGLSYRVFLMKRLPTILIPYLFFSAIGLSLNFKNLTAGVTVNTLLTGGADYHLYFLIILLQCYLLFPLLLWLQRRAEKIFRYSVLIIFLLVVLLLYKTTSERTLSYFGLTHPGWHASLCVYWLPYFMLGVLHGRRPPAPWGTGTAIAAVLVSLVLVLHDYVFYSGQGTPVDYYNHFSRPSVALYALAVIYFLHSLAPHPPTPSPFNGEGEKNGVSYTADNRFAPLSTWWRGAGGEAAKLTFTVYLIHPQILRLLHWKLSSLPALAIWPLTVLIAFLVVYALKRVLTKFENPLVVFFERALGLR
jgi:surface polysaccharide O-acyltransferase-like enzyme